MEFISNPALPAMGGVGAIVGGVMMIWRLNKDLLAPMRAENERLRAAEVDASTRLAEERHANEAMRRQARECATERERMRIAMHVAGIPWDPKEWT